MIDATCFLNHIIVCCELQWTNVFSQLPWLRFFYPITPKHLIHNFSTVFVIILWFKMLCIAAINYAPFSLLILLFSNMPVPILFSLYIYSHLFDLILFYRWDIKNLCFICCAENWPKIIIWRKVRWESLLFYVAYFNFLDFLEYYATETYQIFFIHVHSSV